MNWYKIAKDNKDNEEFSYGEEIRTLWNRLLKKEMDRVNIHFDLENNDGYEVKTKNLDFTGRDGQEQFRIKANICWAGGDWESPICYFRCQIESRSYYNDEWGNWSPMVKTIIIPKKANKNLINGKKGLTARDAGDNQKQSEN